MGLVLSEEVERDVGYIYRKISKIDEWEGKESKYELIST